MTVPTDLPPAPPWAELARTPSALFLDIDGTLLEFESHPGLVRATEGLIELLQAVSVAFDGAVALISGRSLTDIDRVFGPWQPYAAGVHGAEVRGSSGTRLHQADDALLATLRQRVSDELSACQGVWMEDKGHGFALHYRDAPGAEDVVRSLAARAGRARSHGTLEVQPGSYVQELRPAAYDKGLAVDELMEQPPFLRPPTGGGRGRPHRRVCVRRRQHPRRGVRAGGTTQRYGRAVPDRRPGCRSWLALGDSRGGVVMAGDTHPLDLAVIGNGTVGMLVDRRGRYVWGCLPHLAADPSFCELLQPTTEGHGVCSVDLEGFVSSEQHYLPNTAVLVTTLYAEDGSSVEITDFSPRFRRWDRLYHPVMFVRRIRPLAGVPRVTLRVRPLADWGARVPDQTSGSHHIRWVLKDTTLRLTTDTRVPFVERELPLVLDRPVNMILGPDESLTTSAEAFVLEAYDRTVDYWQSWSRSLSIPFEWQDAVIRAAITLKLCQYEGTGAIVAALTTSIPEAPNTERNWDYRYCWLRDAAFVVRTLNQLGATKSMEDFLGYIYTLASATGGDAAGLRHPLRTGAGRRGRSRICAATRATGPVRSGNDAYLQRQHDVYGSVVLASTHLFFDQRLTTPGDSGAFEQLERAGDLAYSVYDQPDAGLWEFRGRARRPHVQQRHVLGGRRPAGEDRPAARTHRARRALADAGRRDARAHPAARPTTPSREPSWRRGAGAASTPPPWCWPTSGSSAPTTTGSSAPSPPSRSSCDEATTCSGTSTPTTSVSRTRRSTCAPSGTSMRWRASGARDEARELFEHILARRNHLGLMSEDLDPETGELWGNFPQTYSMLGIIQIAMRLSRAVGAGDMSRLIVVSNRVALPRETRAGGLAAAMHGCPGGERRHLVRLVRQGL